MCGGVWLSGWCPHPRHAVPPHTALPSTLPATIACRARGNGLAVADSTATAQAVRGELPVQPLCGQQSPLFLSFQSAACVAGQLLMLPLRLRHPPSLQAALPLLSPLPRPLPMAVRQLLAPLPRPSLLATTPPLLPWPRCVCACNGCASHVGEANCAPTEVVART